MSIFLHSSSTPLFLAKGLYAGLKSRNGLATPLPLVLTPDDDYVNTGFIDSLPIKFLRELDITSAELYIEHHGAITVSIYVLLQSGAVFHCADFCLDTDEEERIQLPSIVFTDTNSRSVYFRIKTNHTSSCINRWYYATSDTSFCTAFKSSLDTGFPLISRSLGDSYTLVTRYLALVEEYQSLAASLPHLTFPVLPSLTIYESDHNIFIQSELRVESSGCSSLRVVYNPYNLGGGGNMCLSISNEWPRIADSLCFGMIDSDTILPLRTLYFSSLLLSVKQRKRTFSSYASTVLYSSTPNQVLESGALFGRGNWGIISAVPRQPCIQPLHHRRLLSKPEAQAALMNGGFADYPPFIFSLYSAPAESQLKEFLPIPFFLRGDDIELGQSTRAQGSSCKVEPSLVVFQEPRHSLWHELMAILHGTVLILADAARRGDTSTFPDLHEYFAARAYSHHRIRDLSGLLCYRNVLDRLTSVLDWPVEEIVQRFHDPSYYLELRSLNNSYKASHYRMANALDRSISSDQNRFLKLPFVYFENALPEVLRDPKAPLPRCIALINASQLTAAIIETECVDSEQLDQAYNSIIDQSTHLFLSSCEQLAARCLAICDRDRIVEDFLRRYQLSSPVIS